MRNLDAQIAERVFKWQRWTHANLEYSSILFMPDSDPRKLGPGWQKCGQEVEIRKYGGGNAPEYSTDLTAAWLVVEAMRGNKRFATRFASLRLWEMTAAEAARAICETALECVEVEVK